MYVYLASKASDGLPDWIDQKPELGSTMLQDLIGIRVILETFVRVFLTNALLISDWGLDFFGYLSMTLKAKASKAIYPSKHM